MNATHSRPSRPTSARCVTRCWPPKPHEPVTSPSPPSPPPLGREPRPLPRAPPPRRPRSPGAARRRRLSSLGRSEAHVLATIEEVLSVLARLNGHEPPARTPASRSPKATSSSPPTPRPAGHAGRDSRHADHGHPPDRSRRPASARVTHGRERHGHRPRQLRSRRPEVWARMIDACARHDAPTATGPESRWTSLARSCAPAHCSPAPRRAHLTATRPPRRRDRPGAGVAHRHGRRRPGCRPATGHGRTRR